MVWTVAGGGAEPHEGFVYGLLLILQLLISYLFYTNYILTVKLLFFPCALSLVGYFKRK